MSTPSAPRATQSTPGTTSSTGSTAATPPSGRPTPQSLGPVEMLRWTWTQLTSMRTALALLFLLALGAIPGSLIPQRSQSALKVREFAERNPGLDKFYQPLGMYDVYTSAWFSAIYLLLFVSLIGCILPRIKVYWRAVKGRPPRLPSRLDRLPEHRTASLESDATLAMDSAEQWLRRKHFRTERQTLPDGSQAISAERGYLREFGNLLFHTSLVLVLIGIAWNNLLGFKGSSIMIEGQGFSNAITQYDEYRAGSWVDTDKLPPFMLKLDKFIVRFETGQVQRGAARDFQGRLEVTSAEGESSQQTVRVNHPITVDGNRVHLIGHGYAAHVTVTDGNGDKAWSGPVVFLPQDGNFTSSGVIKAPDGRPDRLALQGIFLPTAPEKGMMGHSLFPDAINPKLFLNAWYGPPKTETGKPENVYGLDTTGMTQMKEGDDVLRFVLKPGEGYDLPDGKGSVVFDGWSRWTKVQISRSPGLPMTFGSIAACVLGLCLSLFVRPRRLWVRTRQVDGQQQVEVGGLDRADARTGLPEDVEALTTAATGRAPGTAPSTATEATKEKQ